MFEFPAEHEKYHKLVRILEKEMDGRRILIFLETKKVGGWGGVGSKAGAAHRAC